MTLPNKTERRAIVDTHRHPWGQKMQAKMATFRRSHLVTHRTHDVNSENNLFLLKEVNHAQH